MLEHSNKFPSLTHIHADGVYTPPRKKRKNAGTILGTLRARPTRPTLYAFPNNTCAARLCAYTRGQERKAAAAAITGAQSATERNENPPPRVYMYTHTLTLCSSLSRSFLLSFLGVSFDTRALHTRLRITEHITDHHYLHSPSARAERERDSLRRGDLLLRIYRARVRAEANIVFPRRASGRANALCPLYGYRNGI